MLTCTVVTPETTVLDTSAFFVALPLFDGEIGIAPAHSPMIGRLIEGGRFGRDHHALQFAGNRPGPCGSCWTTDL